MGLETLDGIISRVLFHRPNQFNSAGLPFLIAKLTNGSVVKGDMSRPVLGDNYRFFGEMVNQKGRDEQAFAFSTFEVLVDDSIPGVAHYLRNHVPGLGVAKSNAIADHFGTDTLTVLRCNPERALEVAKISQAQVDLIRTHFEENLKVDPAAYARLYDLFEGFKIPKKTIERILKDFGSSAPDVVADKPYSVLLCYPGLGWKTVDDFARTKLNYDPMGPDRHSAAILEAMGRISQEGHTYAEKPDIEEITTKLLNARVLPHLWLDLIEQGKLATDGDKLMLPKIASAEEEIASRLVSLAANANPLPCDLDRTGLGDEQAAALETIESSGVSVLTGAPGTGKSYTFTRALVSLLGSGMRDIRVVAPTGKAAKRASELMAGHFVKAGFEADILPSTTIHRALEPIPSGKAETGASKDQSKTNRGREGFSFGRNQANPIEASLVVMDEFSMADVSLAASFLRAISPGTRLLFVGDANQLPSVGPGSVARDLMDAGIPTGQLTKIQRSESAGRVVHACHAIKDGRMPTWGEEIALPVENWVHIELSDPDEIAQEIVDLHNPTKTFPDLLWDYQVVTPQRARLPVACNNLNRLLADKINPASRAGSAQENTNGDFEPPFRPGDKVVRNKNGVADEMVEPGACDHIDWRWDGKDWAFDETEVVNGDMGVVRDIVNDGKRTYVVIQFRNPDRLMRLPFGECDLSLAYAMTCHKAQGSGFPFVIVPVHHSFYWDAKKEVGIFNREWIYTAISRAEKLLITVGQESAIRAAVGRKTVHLRRTRLADLIRREQERHEANRQVQPQPSLAILSDSDAAIEDEIDALIHNYQFG